MARIRSIKPEIAQDAKLATVSRDIRYHFVLLWTVADDEGFFRASARLLLGQLYPHDEDVNEARVNDMNAALVRLGVLEIRPSADGPIGWLVNWLRHQRIDKPSRSHLRETFATLSGDSREPVAPGSRSLEVGVLSPEGGGGAPAADVAGFLREHDFGPFAPGVEWMLRASERPHAVLADLRFFLTGESGYERATPRQLGMAAQQLVANNKPYAMRLFAGYIRGTKQDAERAEVRRQRSAEAQHLESEQRTREREARDEARRDAELRAFEEQYPERFAAFRRQAEKQVPATITFGRDLVVRAELLSLVRGAESAA